ncbi:sigma factor-like helix-turn-helix DNA-binding protein [Isachenkonia alkalipeptolytica]|uniref:RNA polymerase sigma-70 region 4 domain-containing protein n=1 Tax=Isachenkonia alkalipeptolytica TaxID=2565777 RepID=A0AA44BD90_9CLOT|nr:sigma factor-like helix-turn-helix DNA-binding protein [Isachenkonia alkalipeptolytica]NBG87687.1 hypothetical protein [Isachenkonia alkalipeptolytica]
MHGTEYIRKPKWINLKRLYTVSYYFHDFIDAQQVSLEGDTIDLEDLKTYYRLDPIKAKILITELKIRGFGTEPDQPSMLWDNWVIQFPYKYITAELEAGSENFRQVDFKELGLGSFLEQFRVTEDAFFEGVLLNGLAKLNEYTTMDALEEGFTKVGFMVNEIVKEEVLEEIPSEVKARADEALIEDVFEENGFTAFRKYCSAQGLVYIKDLEHIDLDGLQAVKGFGLTKVQKIKERYQQHLISPKAEEEIPRISLPKDKESLDLLIEDYFTGNPLRIFREFCINKGYQTIQDLEGLPYEELYNINGFGKRKIKDVIDKIENLDNLEKKEIVQQLQAGFFEISKDFEAVPVEKVFDGKALRYLTDRRVNNLGDLASIKKAELNGIPGMGKKKVGELKEEIRLYSNSLEGYVAKAFQYLETLENYQIFKERVINKATLSEIGNRKNVSRERIRQKEAKGVKQLKDILTITESVFEKKGYFADRSVIEFDELVDLFQTYERALIVKHFLNEYGLENLTYWEAGDTILVNLDGNRVSVKIKAVVDSYGEIIEVPETLNEMEEVLHAQGLSFINEKILKRFLTSAGYVRYNNLFSRSRLYKLDMMGLLIKKHFPYGIERTAEKAELIRDYMYKEFKIDPKEYVNDRPLWALTENNEELILWKSNSVNHIENVVIDSLLLNKIKDYIDHSIKSNRSVSADYLYNHFKSKLDKHTNISDKNALYGILKYYYQEEYTFKKLVISKRDGKKTELWKLIEDYVSEQGGRIDSRTIKKEFKTSDIMMQGAINNSEKLLSSNRGSEIIHYDYLQFTKFFEVQLYEKILSSFHNGYTNAYMTMKNAKDLLEENNIDDHDLLYSIMKHLFSDKFHFVRRPHVLKASPKTKFTADKLIYRAFDKEKIKTQEDLKKLLQERYRFSYLSTAALIAKAKENLFQLDKDSFTLFKLVSIEEKLIENVRKDVELLLEEKDYIVLNDFKRFDLTERTIDVDGETLPWNPYIVKATIEKYLKEDYKFLWKDIPDWRYDKVIIIRKNSSIDTLGEFMIELIKKEFSQEKYITLKQIEDFMQNEEVIYKKLPEEFFQENQVKIDDSGRVWIR